MISSNVKPLAMYDIQKEIDSLIPECPVSFESLTIPIIFTPCLHRVHQKGLDMLLQNKGDKPLICPVCENVVVKYESDYLTKTLAENLEALKKKILNQINAEEQKELISPNKKPAGSSTASISKVVEPSEKKPALIQPRGNFEGTEIRESNFYNLSYQSKISGSIIKNFCITQNLENITLEVYFRDMEKAFPFLNQLDLKCDRVNTINIVTSHPPDIRKIIRLIRSLSDLTHQEDLEWILNQLKKD